MDWVAKILVELSNLLTEEDLKSINDKTNIVILRDLALRGYKGHNLFQKAEVLSRFDTKVYQNIIRCL